MIRAVTMNSFRRACGYRFPRLGLFAFQTFFRLMPAEVEAELLPGIHARLNLNDLTQRTTYWQGGRFEHPTPAILAEWGEAGAECFFDIGSNYGFFSYWMFSRCSDLRIHAFEPNPKTYATLRGIVERNRLQSVSSYHLGLAEKPGILHLNPGREDSGHSTFGAHPELAGPGGFEVAVATFDQWRLESGLKLPDRPKWIVKMDVEGFELKVLQGMHEALSAKAFAGLAIEVNDFTLKFCDTSRDEVFGLLRAHDYVPLNETPLADRWPLAMTANVFFVPR